MTDIDALVERLDVYAQVAVGDESLVPTELTTKAAAALRELQKRPTREQFILTRDLLSEKIDKQAQRIADLEEAMKQILPEGTYHYTIPPEQQP